MVKCRWGKPKRCHPVVKIFCGQTFDMKRRSIGIDVYVFATRRCRNCCIIKEDLVPNRLARLKSIRQEARLIKSKVATSKAWFEKGMLPGSGSREKELGTLHLLPTLFQNPALKHDCHVNYGVGFGI